jgi:hypothetical protein
MQKRFGHCAGHHGLHSRLHSIAVGALMVIGSAVLPMIGGPVAVTPETLQSCHF